MDLNVVLNVTKYTDYFNDRETGERLEYQYLEIEMAPNCFAKFSLKNSNLRAIQKYNPNLYQFIHNMPDGVTVPFVEAEIEPVENSKKIVVK